MDENLYFANFYHIYPPLAIHGWKATDLSFNLAPRYRDLKDPTSRQNFDDTPGQIPKLILTLRPKEKNRKPAKNKVAGLNIVKSEEGNFEAIFIKVWTSAMKDI